MWHDYLLHNKSFKIFLLKTDMHQITNKKVYEIKQKKNKNNDNLPYLLTYKINTNL